MKLILKIIIALTFLNILFYSCKNHHLDRGEVKKILNGNDNNDNNDIMDVIYLIGENQDTSFMIDIFRLSYDQRVSHKRKFLGMSIHQACMGALEKITHQSPPNKITYKVDSLNIDFYKNLLKKQ